MIAIYCVSCNSHIYNTDKMRLDYPFEGEMFDAINLNWRLRPGKIYLDLFCPVCSAFPFFYQESAAQHNCVGAYLNVGEVGQVPQLTHFNEIIGGGLGESSGKNLDKSQKIGDTLQLKAKPTAKKAKPKPKKAKPKPKKGKPTTKKAKPKTADPLLADIERRVTKGGVAAAENEPPTKAEISEMMIEREQREGRETPLSVRRPMKG